ncbi:MAG: ATP-binding protein [Porticoccaceae bacterium]|nr:ATP-binding protein [Porticoccaceae bacterium]
MSIDWATTVAAIWRPKQASLRAVKRVDTIGFDDLLGIDRQKTEFKDNLALFLSGASANNILLWGSRGTGKSSLVKAALNCYQDKGLRVVEIDKDDLADLPEIVDDLRELPQRFLIFCDDLSFDEGETAYKHLKSILEGSIELPPENVLVCATSNRRHLISEQKTDNAGIEIIEGELHYGDRVEEKLSLSDRFGLWLSFYPNSQAQYLLIVDELFKDSLAAAEIDRKELHGAAKRFAMARASRSGRTAKQFCIQYQRDVATSV